MACNYPLRFTPLPKTRVWGGDALAARAGGATDRPVGESWEICDHGADVSVVANGSLAGRTLRQLLEEDVDALVGDALDPAMPDRFPLMLKLLDSRDRLSVQVHPDDEQARAAGLDDLGKTEAWYILEADEDAAIYRGLAEALDAEAFRRRVEAGAVAEVLRRVPVRAGEVYHLPAGTIHALGAGLRLAEIQQNSDTTFRLFDWNRVGLDGQPRELHVEAGLAVADLSVPDADRAEPEAVAQEGARRERFASCEKFVLDRLHGFSHPAPLDTDRAGFHILTVVGGAAEVHTAGGVEALGRWDSVLVPAAAGEYTLAGDAETMVLLFARPEAV